VQARVAVFREGLAQLGWTERNVRIEERFAGGDADQMQAYAAELVGSAPDVIVANSTPVLGALKQATRTIPIVFSITQSCPSGNSCGRQGFRARLTNRGPMPLGSFHETAFRKDRHFCRVLVRRHHHGASHQ
jgi:hypothetical protein